MTARCTRRDFLSLIALDDTVSSMSRPVKRRGARVLRDTIAFFGVNDGRRRNMRRNPWAGINRDLEREYDEAWQRGLDERCMIEERSRPSSDPRRYEEGFCVG